MIMIIMNDNNVIIIIGVGSAEEIKKITTLEPRILHFSCFDSYVSMYISLSIS